MTLADVHPRSVSPEHINEAVANRDREGLRVEYKERVPSGSEALKEWAADVTSLANTVGGVIVLGIVDEHGRAARVEGYEPEEADDEMLRLSNSLRDRVDPTLPGLHFEAMDVDGGTVIVVSIPRSWAAPHLVRSGSNWKVFRRTSAGKYPLQDAWEVRTFFAETEDAIERTTRWHTDRLLEALSGEAPMQPKEDVGALVLMTLRPIAAGAPGSRPTMNVPDLIADDTFQRECRPLRAGPTRAPRPNLHGVVGVSQRNDGYVQVYRDGSVEFVDFAMLGDVPEQLIAGRDLAYELVKGLNVGLMLGRMAGAELPVVCQLTISGVQGARMAPPKDRVFEYPYEAPVISVDRLPLPPAIIEEEPVELSEVAQLLRPALDTLWNAAGQGACPYFDAEGKLS